SITSVTPNSGPSAGGTAVTISGSNFASGATVRFGGTPATAVAVVNSSTINATTPAHSAGDVSVTVTNPDAQRATFNSFTYQAPVVPNVTSIAPSNGST